MFSVSLNNKEIIIFSLKVNNCLAGNKHKLSTKTIKLATKNNHTLSNKHLQGGFWHETNNCDCPILWYVKVYIYAFSIYIYIYIYPSATFWTLRKNFFENDWAEIFEIIKQEQVIQEVVAALLL